MKEVRKQKLVGKRLLKNYFLNLLPSFPRRRESILFSKLYLTWIPRSGRGMTYLRLFQQPVKNKRTEAGFTIVELMITMVAFVFVIAAASQMLTGLMTQFKQQSKITETNIEGIIGLNILRQDIEHAGYGLPWNGLVAYTEPAPFNDSPNAPRAILSNNNTEFNASDYLVIKAVNVATNNTAAKWALLAESGILKDDISGDAFEGTDVVTIISPGSTGTNSRTLISYNTSYNDVSSFVPEDNTDVRLVYGINNDEIIAPFNRADYYISTNNVPVRCATPGTGTGVLVKATLNHGAGGLDEMPILDCVADMQVIYRTDTNNDGTLETTDSLGTIDAQTIREQVKEIRVYILTHEGQRDPNYIYPTNPLTVGEFGLGSSFNFSTAGITDWQNYRWKIYTIVVKPENLGS